MLIKNTYFAIIFVGKTFFMNVIPVFFHARKKVCGDAYVQGCPGFVGHHVYGTSVCHAMLLVLIGVKNKKIVLVDKGRFDTISYLDFSY